MARSGVTILHHSTRAIKTEEYLNTSQGNKKPQNVICAFEDTKDAQVTKHFL